MDSKSKVKKKYLDKGLAKLQRAAEADRQDNLTEALSLYVKGTGHLYNSLQYDDHTEEEKKSLHANYLEYLRRVEHLEKIIDDEKRRKKEEKRNSKKKKDKKVFRFQQGGSFEDEKPRPQAPNTAPLARRPLSPPSSSQQTSPTQPNIPQHSKPVRAVPPTAVASVRPLPPAPPSEEEDFPPFKTATLKRRPPPPVPNTPRPVITSGSATVGRRPKQPASLNQMKQPLSTSPSLPLMSKQRAQIHREPEIHSSGTLNRIHNKYNMNDKNGQSSNERKKPFNSLDSDTLLANAQTIIAMATHEDLKGNYSEALLKYEDAVKLFYYILREYPAIAPASKESIRSHCVLYQDRIDTLKGMLAHLNPCQRSVSRDTSDIEFDKEYKEVITTEKPNTTLNTVAGHDQAKELMISTILSPIKFPQAFAVSNGQNPRNILLYGPPGCGKTYLAKALACESKTAAYFYTKASNLVSKYLSNRERLIEVLFEKAREHSPSIIIVDDLEYLQHKGNESEDSFWKPKQQLAAQITEKSNVPGVYVIGVTNKPWNLDSTFKQSFDRCVGVTLPDLPSRIKILDSHLKMIQHSLNERQMLQLAHQTDGFSGADISTLLHDALMLPVYRLQNATHFRMVNFE
eukprot:TCONS_00070947-protein